MGSVLAASGGVFYVVFALHDSFKFTGAGNATVSLGEVLAMNITYPSSNLLIPLSVENVDLSKISIADPTRFRLTVNVLVAIVDAPCDERNLTLTFTCVFSPLRERDPFASTVRSVILVSTSTSSLLGFPISSMANVGMVSISSVAECMFSDLDPVDAALSPTQAALGPQRGQYYRGAVVVAILCYACFALVVCGVGYVGPMIRPGTSKNHLFGIFRFPSSMMIFVSSLHQGIASCSTSLARLGNALDFALGMIGLAVALGTTLLAALATRGSRLQCVQARRSIDELHSKHPPVQLFLNAALWKKHWLNTPEGREIVYKRRYLLLLDDTRVPWWVAAELSSGLVQGVIIGIRRNSSAWCKTQQILLAIHCAVMFGAAIYIRPCGSSLGNFFLAMSKLGSLTVALWIVIGTAAEASNLTDVAMFATGGFAFVASTQTAVQLVLAIVLARKSILAFARSGKIWHENTAVDNADISLNFLLSTDDVAVVSDEELELRDHPGGVEIEGGAGGDTDMTSNVELETSSGGDCGGGTDVVERTTPTADDAENCEVDDNQLQVEIDDDTPNEADSVWVKKRKQIRREVKQQLYKSSRGKPAV